MTAFNKNNLAKFSFSMTALATRRLRRRMSFSKTFWNRSLRKCLPIKLVRLVLMIILNKSFGKFSFRNSAYSRTIRSNHTSFQQTVPDSKLSQLHLSQLRQQDPKAAISRQLPEEPLLASGLRTAAWPAAVQSDQLSFSKQKLAQQDLSNISLEEFFPENFGKQLLDHHLSAQQLQNNQLQKNNFQQLSLEHPQLQREDLAQGACNNLCQEQLDRQPCLSERFLCQLGFAEGSFRTAWREQP